MGLAQPGTRVLGEARDGEAGLHQRRQISPVPGQIGGRPGEADVAVHQATRQDEALHRVRPCLAVQEGELVQQRCGTVVIVGERGDLHGPHQQQVQARVQSGLAQTPAELHGQRRHPPVVTRAAERTDPHPGTHHGEPRDRCHVGQPEGRLPGFTAHPADVGGDQASGVVHQRVLGVGQFQLPGRGHGLRPVGTDVAVHGPAVRAEHAGHGKPVAGTEHEPRHRGHVDHRGSAMQLSQLRGGHRSAGIAPDPLAGARIAGQCGTQQLHLVGREEFLGPGQAGRPVLHRHSVRRRLTAEPPLRESDRLAARDPLVQQ